MQDSHSFNIHNYIPASSENVYLPHSNESKKKQMENITIIKLPEPTTITTTPEIGREKRENGTQQWENQEFLVEQDECMLKQRTR